MNALVQPRLLVALILGFAFGLACRVNLADDLVYSCKATADCGGDGYVCASPPGGVGYCCKASGAEVCDGVDNDCDGKIDNTGLTERCNGVDDDCNGQVDELFDLTTDSANCGQCGATCAGTENCVAGVCKLRPESSCADKADNDGDGKIDCADADCNGQVCYHPACKCSGGKPRELGCTNGIDDDEDGDIDCADIDCNGAGCATPGCICKAPGKAETNCFDLIDNDGDGKTDCADSDCVGSACKAAPLTFTCSANLACACNDGGVVTEATVLCRDHLDNDCNGQTDCEESACNGLSCARDGGSGCRCELSRRVEKSCNDRVDNDEDGVFDCGDSLPDGGGDCPIGTACTFINSGGQVKSGSCKATHLCEP